MLCSQDLRNDEVIIYSVSCPCDDRCNVVDRARTLRTRSGLLVRGQWIVLRRALVHIERHNIPNDRAPRVWRLKLKMTSGLMPQNLELVKIVVVILYVFPGLHTLLLPGYRNVSGAIWPETPTAHHSSRMCSEFDTNE